ncbi:MAG: tetratricopeptide repeat protein [Muribaculaceae bacterium]|nr:tetratricopeptide repeat protein [Muribaculaceae bacterium]
MNYRLFRHILLFVTVTTFITALFSCSPKKNNAATRRYQAFITKYNIYYNGDTHFKETLKEMENKYEDDYSQLLFMHPIEAKNNPKSPQPSGSFDRSIEKAQKAIQLRSITKRPKKKSGKQSAEYKEWLKREEYNPFLHNAWMMMGRSQFFNGDFLGAASTFFYTSKHFRWLPETVTEAQLWQARSYCALDWLFETENIIIKIKDEQLTNNTLKELYNNVYANYYIKLNDYDKAIPYLQKAIDYADGSQKTRLRFLLGQLYSRIGKKQEAYEAFKKAGGASSAPYRTKFNARIKQSEVYTGDNIESEVKALKRMTRYDRNKDFLDQVYYAIGNIYLSRKDTLKAIENYEMANKKSTRNGIDKAINQVTLGNLYYIRHNYDKAQPCYSEAVPQLPENYPNYLQLKRRSDVLDELAVYSQNVTLQDSLLRLSELTPEQLDKVINKIIEDLKKKEKEEEENAKREEYLAQQRAQGSNLQNTGSSAPKTFTLNTDDSWYFYNTATKNAGKTEFQKNWGSRKLEDNWRRRNKASFDSSEFEANNDGEDGEENDSVATDSTGKELTKEDEEKLKRAEDPHFPEYYIKQIPKTDEEKNTAHEIIQEGLYNMGIILKDKMEDFSASRSEFDRLLTRYPDNIYRLDTYYNLYIMAVRQNDYTEAEKYRSLIIEQFPESNYGIAMQDPDYLENLKTMNTRQEELYTQAYNAYLNNNNGAVHEAYEYMIKEYPLSRIIPKFMFLHALAYVTEKDSEKFNSTLKELLEKYPETDITPLASSYLKQMAQGRKLESSSSNLRGMIWDTRLGSDSIANANASKPAEFTINPDEPQLLVLLFSTKQVASNQLLYDIARFNFNTFDVKSFDLEQMSFGELGLIVIKGFNNQKELDRYRQILSTNSEFALPKQVRPVNISAKNFELLLSEGRSFEEYFNFIGEEAYIATEEEVLPPSEFGESEGIPSDDEIKEMEQIEQNENTQSEEVKQVETKQESPKAEEKAADMPQQQETPKVEEKKEEKKASDSNKNDKKDDKKDKNKSKKENKDNKKDNKKNNTRKSQISYPTGSEGDDPLLDTP